MSDLSTRVFYLLKDKSLRQQIVRFVVTGFSGLFTDVSVYRMLVKFGAHVTPAKALGCTAGTVLVFFINRAWTFANKQTSFAQVLRFVLLYGSSIVLNTALNTLGLKIVPQPWQLAFVFATGVTTVVNFLGSKFFVFNAPANADVAVPALDIPELNQDFADSSRDTVAVP